MYGFRYKLILLCLLHVFILNAMDKKTDTPKEPLKIDNRSNLDTNYCSNYELKDEKNSTLATDNEQLGRNVQLKKVENWNILSSTFSLRKILSLVYGPEKIGVSECKPYDSADTRQSALHEHIASQKTQPITVDGLYTKTNTTQKLYSLKYLPFDACSVTAALTGILGAFAAFGIVSLFKNSISNESVSGIVTAGFLLGGYAGWYESRNRPVIDKKHKIFTYEPAKIPNDTFHLQVDKHLQSDNLNKSMPKVYLVCHHHE